MGKHQYTKKSQRTTLYWCQVYGMCAVKTAPELNSQRGEAPTQGKALTGTSLGNSTKGRKVPRIPNQGSSRAFSAFSCSHTESECHIEMPSLIATWWWGGGWKLSGKIAKFETVNMLIEFGALQRGFQQQCVLFVVFSLILSFLCFRAFLLNPIDRMLSHLAQREGIC